MKKFTFWLKVTTFVSALTCTGLIVGTFSALQFSQGLPDAQGIREIELKVPLRVYSADGLLISEFGNERRIPIDYEETPQALIDAVLASEDDNFFNHLGIDFFGLVRAALANFSSGRSGQGASTITMQVARNFYLSPEKTYTRKIKEILLAIRLEQELSKQEILSLYLNKIFLGHRAYGFGAAAEVYYGKPLSELNLAQISMLAGLPKAPSSYNPIRNPERATIRRNYVLNRMKSLDWISETEFDEASKAPVTAERHARETGLDAPHIAEMVRAQLTEQYGEDAYWQGLNVYTTIQTDKQIAAGAALRAGLQAYDKRHGFRGPVAKAALDEPSNSPADARKQDQVYEKLLRDYPDSQDQTPGLVIALDKKSNSAKVWSREAGLISLEFDTVKWAKKHINANRVGSEPKSIGRVLSTGDIVYIQPIKHNKNTETPVEQDSTPTQWQLSQLPAVSGALISLDPETGAIISLVGGYDFFLNKYNRATQSVRQPGSNIKPFIYSASLDKGFTPASRISGAPIVLTDPAHGTRWRPENYSGKFFGPTRMRVALSKSMNLVSIRLLRAIGIPYARDYLSRFGIDMNRFSNSLTMALGSGGVKPIEMISAYAVLANGGYKIKPYFIERITDRDGKTIFVAPKPQFCDECLTEYLPKPELSADQAIDSELDSNLEADTNTDPEKEFLASETIDSEELVYSAPRVMSYANNFLTVSMLKDVINRGTARKALTLERPDLAGKTGTTNDYVDAWFTGFTPKVVTTVWVGFDQPQSMGRGEAGSLAALPIWVDYMETGLQDIPQDQEKIPAYIEEGFIDRNTGDRVDESSPSATPEFFVLESLTPDYEVLKQHSEALNANSELGIYQDSASDLVDLLDPQFNTDSVELDENGEPINIPTNDQRIIESDEDTEGLF